MHDYLVLSLVAPMGAFGGLAGHEIRGTHNAPGRSALLGLIGAALGIRRDDRERQKALDVWKTAVSVIQVSEAWQDFHTVQTVPKAAIKRPATRRAALENLRAKDHPLVTRRSYRSDCAFGVALWGGDIPTLKSAFCKPYFVPYLGRKSCPLSAPMIHPDNPLQAENPIEALANVKLPPFLEHLNPSDAQLILSDEDLGGEFEGNPLPADCE